MPTTITSAGVTFTDTTTLTSADGVPSALKLTTARTINGVSFDGTANITVPATASGANVAKAWVNFDGTLSTPITPRASYNVTSVTKSTTGTYTLNFPAGLFTNANYLVVCGSMNRQNSGNSTPDQTGILVGATNTPSLKTTTQLSIGYIGGGGQYDGSEIHVAIFAS